jgi:putative flavoprotein involved in K+ transport
MIDKYIQSNNLNSPYEKVEELKDGYKQSIIEKLDLKEADVNTIIWAGGYSFDYSLVKMPVLDPDGFPIQQRGVTSYPGLYFVGLPWMPSQRSGFLIGVAECAKYIAEKITEKRNPPV